jgi:hypothetical protein
MGTEKTNLGAILICALFVSMLLIGVGSSEEPKLKRAVLTDTQFKLIQSLETEIGDIPRVKELRAQQQGIIAGIATSNGMTRWTWKIEKGQMVIEEAPEPTPTPTPKLPEGKP